MSSENRNQEGKLVKAVVFAAKVTWVMVAMVLALMFGQWMADLARPSAEPVTPPKIEGDDNRDGTIDEDESGWDCTTMGNRVCRTTAV